VTAGSPLLVSSPSIDAGAIARFGEIDRAGRAYEAAIAALVAEAEAIADSFDESLVVVTAEHEVPQAVAAADTGVREAIAESEVAQPTDVPGCDPNYDQYVTNSTTCGAVDAAAVVAPLPEPDPVALPTHVVTPAQPMPALTRPHSVAVIVARGADF
jgi:hypothetical protein